MDKIKIEVRIRNLSFIVNILDDKLLDGMKYFISSNSTYKKIYIPHIKRMKTKLDKTFIAILNNGKTFIFNINYIKKFFSITGSLWKLNRDEIKIIREDMHNIEKLHVHPHKDKTLRDYQVEYVDRLTKNDNIPFKLVNLYTGGGKTFIACSAITRLNMRTLVIVLPKYMDKWREDILNNSDAIEDDILTVSGSGELNRLIESGLNNELDKGFIIISLRTIYNYIRDYEQGLSNKYKCSPLDFTKILKVGIILNDETHLEFYSVYKTALYFDVKLFIGLTATLMSSDSNITKLHKIMFPPDSRIENIVKQDRYINTVSVMYSLPNIKSFKVKSNHGYSHGKLEQLIFKKRSMIDRYGDMVINAIDRYYIKYYKDSDKCLVFFYLIKACNYFTNLLKKKYKDKVVKRYVQGDPYENLFDADIIVSTINKSGTAVDIPQLTTVVNTINISSPQANLQTHGRLRKIPNRELWYIYFYSSDIPQHNRYHNERLKLLGSKTKEYIHEHYYNEIV